MPKNCFHFQSRAPEVIHFLQSLYKKENQRYRTFNSHRSALSLILQNDLGSNLLIKRYLKGISRERPAKPKYDSTWNPEPVLQYLEGSDDSNLMELSHKVVTLLALVTGGRLQTLSLIWLSKQVTDDQKIQILISDPTKTSFISKSQPCLHIPFFQDNSSICPATALVKYIKLTKASVKTKTSFSSLMQSHIKEHLNKPSADG